MAKQNKESEYHACRRYWNEENNEVTTIKTQN
jgi:hypothetical protein